MNSVDTDFFPLVVGEKSGITGSDVLILPLDIAQRDSHSQSFQEVLQHFGSVSFVYYNHYY